MHVPQKLRKELKRKGTKALAFFLAFVLAVQCMNLPVIAAAATDAAGNALATVEDTPSNDQATSAATDQAADQAATETEQPATEQAPVEQPAEPAEPAGPATEEPAATEAPAADQPAESATPAGSENVTGDGASENGQAPVAPAADTTATVALSLAQSTLTVGADTYTATDKTMEAPANQELKFSVAPEGGFTVKTVKQIAADRTETELSADASGTYTVAPEAVADGLEIKVETEEAPAAEEQPAEEAPAEEPATDESTDAATDEATDPAEDEPATEESAEDETATDEQTPADEATEGDAVQNDPDAEAEETTGSAEVLPEETVKADVKSPAYEGYAYVGNIVVKVTAGEGVLPEGTVVKASRVNRQDVIDAVSAAAEQSGMVLEDAVAIDVTLYDADGNAIQPDDAVNVCFFNTAFGSGQIGVYRVADDASTVQAIGARQADPTVQSFDVDHFTIYVGAEMKATATYKFYNGDEEVSSQVVRDGGTLVTPPTPTVDGKTFLYWEIDGNKLDLSESVRVSEPGTTVRVDAKFADAAYIFFMDGTDENARVIRTKQGVAEQKDTVNDVTFPVDAEHGIEGWYYDKGLTNPVEDNSVTYTTDPIILYPKVSEGNYITFDSNDGSYVAPAFYLPGQKTVAPDAPSRPGYQFVRWTTDEDGKNPFTWGSTIDRAVKLYAQWEANNNTKYTVIYWTENANDDGYSFYDSETFYGKTGTTTEVTAKPISVSGVDLKGNNVSDEVFTPQPIQQESIEGDGATIVNVYYSRKEYTLHFRESRYSQQDRASITKKWGATITKEEWPASSSYGWYKNNNWQIENGGMFGTDRYLAFTGSMPMGDGVLWVPNNRGNNTLTATYYVEALSPYDEDAIEVTWGERWNKQTGWFVEHHSDTILANSSQLSVGKEDRYAIEGFTLIEGDPSTQLNRNYNGAKFYYTRNSYNVVYMNNGSQAKTESYKYEADISGAESYKPERPDSIPANYEFKGWYADPEGTTPYEFTGKTMPANNITVYAKWAAPTHTVKFYESVDAQEPTKKLEIDDISVIDPAQVPEINVPDGYKFFGWATRNSDGNLVLFNMNEAVQEDLDLYPYLVSNTSAQITYDANGGEGSVVDEKYYAQGTQADVQSAGGIKAPAGKVFVGWNTEKDGSGVTYYPGAKFEITAEIVENGKTLYAQWADPAKVVTVTYHANYPEGITGGANERPITGVPNNSTLSALTLDEAGFAAASSQYKFIGWTTDEEGNNGPIQPGDSFQVTEEGSNDLYAQWQAKPSIEDVKVDSPTDVPYDGDAHKWAPTVTDGETALVEGVDYEVSYSTDNFTDVTGEIKVTITGKGNYSGTVERTYQITPAQLTVAADSKTKVFGEADPELTHTDGKAVKEEVPAFTGALERDKGEDAGKSYTIRRGSLDLADNPETGFKASNYEISFQEGTLTITDKSIETGKDVKVDSPTDVPYDGDAHKWAPTVTDGETALVEGVDYEVSYSTDNFTDVTGEIKVTITGKGNYSGTVERTYQITPREIVLTIDNQTKVAGTADPTFTSSYEGTVPGEVAGWSFQTGHVRDAGEAVGSYAINQGDMQLADNPSTGFLASNYTLRVIPGTLTITPAPATPGDGGTGTNPGTNPGGGTGTNPGAGTTATPTPATATDGTAAAATDATAEAIDDDATPLASGTERISDDETPLASGREDRDCWVHWLMFVGLVVSAIYYIGALIHRRKFTGDLKSYEDSVLNPDDQNRA